MNDTHAPMQTCRVQVAAWTIYVMYQRMHVSGVPDNNEFAARYGDEEFLPYPQQVGT